MAPDLVADRQHEAPLEPFFGPIFKWTAATGALGRWEQLPCHGREESAGRWGLQHPLRPARSPLPKACPTGMGPGRPGGCGDAYRTTKRPPADALAGTRDQTRAVDADPQSQRGLPAHHGTVTADHAGQRLVTPSSPPVAPEWRDRGRLAAGPLHSLPATASGFGHWQVQAGVDRLSSKVHAVPTHSTDPAAEARSGDGVPDVPLVDHDPEFTSALLQAFTRSSGPGLLIGWAYQGPGRPRPSSIPAA